MSAWPSLVSTQGRRATTNTIELLGIGAITIMVVSYALEKRHPAFIAVFAVGCALAAFYAYLIQSIPFLIAEGIWSAIAFRRWYVMKDRPTGTTQAEG